MLELAIAILTLVAIGLRIAVLIRQLRRKG
jgi:hypothetical protein